MITHRLFPSGRAIRIIAAAAMLLSTAGCGAVIEDVFEGGYCADRASEVGRVTVAPRSWTMAVGDSVNVKADVADRQGNWSLCLPFATWTSRDSTVAAVRKGIPLLEATRAVAIRPGTVYLKATAQGYHDSVRITVTTR